jgi:hypothetical protein
MIITAEAMDEVARATIRWPTSRKWNSKDKQERFKSLFGANIDVITEIWNRIEQNVDAGVVPKHLLYGLVFLKVYGKSEEVHCAIVDWPTAKTFREKSWHIIECIADLKDSVIKLDNRFINAPPINGHIRGALLVIDCTDCKINEPYPFCSKWLSQKFKGPGLKYEVAVAIHSDNICWYFGPFPAHRNESRIFTEGLSQELPGTEPVECDSGPEGDERLMDPQAGMTHQDRKQKSNHRAKIESIFSRMKQFNVLDTHFHHSYPDKEDMMYKHQICFESVLIITQLKLQMGGDKLMDSGPYEVEYDMAGGLL